MVLIPADDVDPSTSADIQYVYREWYGETAVRASLVDHGMLILSHKGPADVVKMSIKDCVRNMYVLMPLLQRIPSDPDQHLFTIKAARSELLS